MRARAASGWVDAPPVGIREALVRERASGRSGFLLPPFGGASGFSGKYDENIHTFFVLLPVWDEIIIAESAG